MPLKQVKQDATLYLICPHGHCLPITRFGKQIREQSKCESQGIKIIFKDNKIKQVREPCKDVEKEINTNRGIKQLRNTKIEEGKKGKKNSAIGLIKSCCIRTECNSLDSNRNKDQIENTEREVRTKAPHKVKKIRNANNRTTSGSPELLTVWKRNNTSAKYKPNQNKCDNNKKCTNKARIMYSVTCNKPNTIKLRHETKRCRLIKKENMERGKHDKQDRTKKGHPRTKS